MSNMIVSRGYRKRGFDAFGASILRKEDMAYWVDHEDRVDPAGVAIGLGEDIELVESGFFEMVPTIYSLWMENPKCKIQMTDDVVKLFQKNYVLIRGHYDSTAENLAREYHLRFLHLDIQLASIGDYFERGNDIATLRFYDDGSAYYHQDCRCQGSSAGSVGGGEVSINLPDDFYLTMTAKDVVSMKDCWGSLGRAVLDNGKLAAVMKKAKSKGGFLLDFSKKSSSRQ